MLGTQRHMAPAAPHSLRRATYSEIAQELEMINEHRMQAARDLLAEFETKGNAAALAAGITNTLVQYSKDIESLTEWLQGAK